MSVQSACVTRQTLGWSHFLSAALPTLAILVDLPPPRTKGQNPQPHFTLQYKTYLLLVHLMADQSVKVNVGRAGGLSHALTENVQIKGKSDSFPTRFDLSNYKDFDLSKTEKNLSVAGVSTNAQQITIQNRGDGVYELEDRFDVISNATYGGSTFETRLKEGCFTEDAQPTVGLITDPDPFMITVGEKRTVTILMDVIPATYSVNVCCSNMSHRRMSIESLGSGRPAMIDHEITDGRLVIHADGDFTTLDVQTVEDDTPESEAELLIAFHFEGHTPVTPKHRAVNTFTSDCATKIVVVKIVDDDTPQPSQHPVYLSGASSSELADRPQATLKAGENTELSVTRSGAAILSDVPLPLKFKGFPVDEAISSDDRTPASVPIGNVRESSCITLQTTDDSMDKGYSEFLTIKFDSDSKCWLSGNTIVERRRFEIVMVNSDKTLANLLKLSAAALTEATDVQQATCLRQLTPRPKADPTGKTPFGSVGNDEGISGVNT